MHNIDLFQLSKSTLDFKHANQQPYNLQARPWYLLS